MIRLNIIEKLLHKHDYKLAEVSNALQLDDFGYPLRLCIECCKCGASRQVWIDTICNEDNNDFILKWKKI